MAANKENAMADINKEMQDAVSNVKKQIGNISGNAIRVKQNKTFTLPDGQTSPGPLYVIILDWVTRNLYYEGRFDPENPTPPTCFAIGRDLDSLAPSDNSPEKQHDSCKSCPMNQFGSSGRGKACKNTRLLAVMQPPTEGYDPSDADIMTLSVSPTALKSYDSYAATLANSHGKLPIAVVTEVGFNPSYEHASLQFKAERPLEQSEIATYWGRRTDADLILTQEPDLTGGEEESSASTTKKTTKKKTSRK